MSTSTPHRPPQAEIPVLRAAITGFLARYKGQSRIHAESDLNAFFRWCETEAVEPLTCRRVDIELYLRWMQLTCKYKPSTVSRRLSVAAGFFKTCVIDGLLANGSGRHSRFMTDLVLRALGAPEFTWGGGQGSALSTATEVRARYLAALRAADVGDYEALLSFVRS